MAVRSVHFQEVGFFPKLPNIRETIRTLAQKVREFVSSVWALVVGVSLLIGAIFGVPAGVITGSVISLALWGARKRIQYLREQKQVSPPLPPPQTEKSDPPKQKRRRARNHVQRPPLPNKISQTSLHNSAAAQTSSGFRSAHSSQHLFDLLPRGGTPPSDFEAEGARSSSFVHVGNDDFAGQKEEGDSVKVCKTPERGREEEDDSFSAISTPGSTTSGEDLKDLQNSSRVVKHYPDLWLKEYQKGKDDFINFHCARKYIRDRMRDIADTGRYLSCYNRNLCDLYDPLHTGTKEMPLSELFLDFPKCKISSSRNFYQGKPTIWVSHHQMDELFEHFADFSPTPPLVLAMGNRLEILKQIQDCKLDTPLTTLCLCSTLERMLEQFHLREVLPEEALFMSLHIVGPSKPSGGYPLRESSKVNFLVLPEEDISNREVLKAVIRKVLRCGFSRNPKLKKIVITEEYLPQLKSLDSKLICECISSIKDEKEFQFAPEIYLVTTKHFAELSFKSRSHGFKKFELD